MSEGGCFNSFECSKSNLLAVDADVRTVAFPATVKGDAVVAGGVAGGDVAPSFGHVGSWWGGECVGVRNVWSSGAVCGSVLYDYKLSREL